MRHRKPYRYAIYVGLSGAYMERLYDRSQTGRYVRRRWLKRGLITEV